jgi:hypothetical protein
MSSLAPPGPAADSTDPSEPQDQQSPWAQPGQPAHPAQPAQPTHPAQPAVAPPPRARRGLRVKVLVPLVLLGVVAGGVGQAAAAGVVTAHQAGLQLRHGSVTLDADTVTSALEARRGREVTKVLDRMSAALAKRDLPGYLAAFDRDAGLRSRQTATFQALGRLPFAEIRYGWNDDRWSRPAGLTREYGDDAFVAVVNRRYHLKGWDTAPTGELVALTFATRDGRWTVVGDEEASTLPSGTVPEPWAFGDVSVFSTPHVLLVGDRAPSRQADLRRLADRVEDAVRDVRPVWSAPSWNGKVVVYAVTDRRFLSSWFGDQWSDGKADDDDPAEFDAWVSTIEESALDGTVKEYPVAGSRMVITPGMLRYTAEEARTVIRHELTHAATFMQGKEMPTWLSEGVAEYTAFRVMRSSGKADGVEALHRRGLPEQLWRDLRASSYRPELVIDHGSFYAGTGDQVFRRYSEGWFAALYIADEYGEAKLRAFVAKACDPTYGSASAREDVALRDVLGTTRAAFVKDVGEYARGLRRNFQ